jgi:DNA-binding MarR family transcriptional regulator
VLVVDRTTLTRNVAPLERAGLIETAPSGDRRERLLRVTGKGLAALEEATPLWERAQESMVEGLGAPRWKGLIADLSAATSMTAK